MDLKIQEVNFAMAKIPCKSNKTGQTNSNYPDGKELITSLQ